jgi:hypothetical protein
LVTVVRDIDVVSKNEFVFKRVDFPAEFKVTEVNPVQFLKAYDSINVIVLGIVTLINDEHPEKELLLIDSTELEKVILDNEEQPEKHAVPMNDTEFGIVIDVRDEQPKKQLKTIDSREFGSVIFGSAAQPEKHAVPKDVTEFGIVTLVKLVQA